MLILAGLLPGMSLADGCPEGDAAPIELRAGADSHFIGQSAAVLDDPEGRLDYENVLVAEREGRFRRHCRADLTPPPAGGALWVRFALKRVSGVPDDWVVTFSGREIDEARLYTSLPGGVFALKRTGRAVPQALRDMASRYPAVSIALEAGTGSTYYLRLAGATSPYLSVMVVDARTFSEREGIDLLILAGVLGFIIAMLAYNLVIYVRSGLHQCLYYFLYLGCIFVHVVIYDGLIYRFTDFLLAGDLADALAQIFGIAAGVSIVLFGRSLLRLPLLMPWMDRMIVAGVMLMVLSVAAETAGMLPPLVVSSVSAILGGLMVCGCATWFAFKGYRPAVYFSLSFVALVAGVILDSLAFYYPITIGAMPSVWVSLIGVQQKWSFLIGVCAEAILISFAITYFIREIRTDAEGARAEAEKTREAAAAARQEFTEKYTDLARRVGIRNDDADGLLGRPASGAEEFRRNAVARIRENLADETFDVAKLAGALAMSERTLRRRVREAADMSPVEFLRRVRLEKGREHLENGTYQTVAEVARAVGIASPGYFARHYREMFGRSPGEVLRKG